MPRSPRVERRKYYNPEPRTAAGRGLGYVTSPFGASINVFVSTPITERAVLRSALARHLKTGKRVKVGDLIIGAKFAPKKTEQIFLRTKREMYALRSMIARSASIPYDAIGDHFFYYKGNFYTFANFFLANVRNGIYYDRTVPALLIRNPGAKKILLRALHAQK